MCRASRFSPSRAPAVAEARRSAKAEAAPSRLIEVLQMEAVSPGALVVLGRKVARAEPGDECLHERRVPPVAGVPTCAAPRTRSTPATWTGRSCARPPSLTDKAARGTYRTATDRNLPHAAASARNLSRWCRSCAWPTRRDVRRPTPAAVITAPLPPSHQAQRDRGRKHRLWDSPLLAALRPCRIRVLCCGDRAV